MLKLFLDIRKKGNITEVKIDWPTKIMGPRVIEVAFPLEIASNQDWFDDPNLDLQDFGSKIFSSIFFGPVENFYRQILFQAEKYSEELVIVLSLDKFFTHIPWELMFDRQNSKFLSLDVRHILLRVPSTKHYYNEEAKPTNRSGLPARLLQIVADPDGPDDPSPIDATKFPKLLKRLEERRLVKIHQINKPDTLYEMKKLATTMREDDNEPRFSIVYLEAHGIVSNGLGKIILCDSNNNSYPVAPNEFSIKLAEFADIKVVILSNCWSGDFYSPNFEFQFGSLARSLIANGFKIVIAMNGPIIQKPAELFIRTFLEQTIREQMTVATAVTKARRVMYANLHEDGKSDSQFYLPSIYTTLNSSSIFEPVYDPTKLDTRDLDVETNETVDVLVYSDEGRVSISVLSVAGTENSLTIKIKAELTPDEVEYEIKLGASKPVIIVGGEKREANIKDELPVSNQKILYEELVFYGAFPSDVTTCSLFFNREINGRTTQSPPIIIENIPLPLGTKNSISIPSIESKKEYTFGNPEWDYLLDKCSTIREFIRFCQFSKINWEKAEHWLAVGLLNLWASEYLANLDLTNYINQVFDPLDPTSEEYLAIWEILIHLDQSLTAPRMKVLTGKRDGTVILKNLLPGKKTSKTIKLIYGNPSGYLSGQIKSNHDCLLVNNVTNYRFKSHSEDCPIYLELSINTWAIIGSLSDLDKLELVIQPDGEYVTHNTVQRIIVPVTGFTDPIIFYIGLSLPFALTLLLLIAIYIILSAILGDFLNFTLIVVIMIGILPFVILTAYHTYTRVIIDLLDLIIQRH
ncbi:CHAT domain-containing protein [Candidatus Leptofilum sp.]|uniref:CHAT domain-containing protein n=1 Tax=Candidatus Leptofilum sp. TaxID=3241576 RepID=UPI003B5BFAAF